MAPLHILRKVVPAAIRTLTHASPLHSAARFAVRIRIPEITKRTPWAEITGATFASKSEGEENLLQILDSEIQYALESDPPREDLVPKGAIPFTIEDKPGEQSICLRRKYGDEDIKVEVMPLDIGEQDEEDEDDEERGRSGETHVTMIVTISKGEGRRFLEFICSGYSDEIAIDSMSVRESDESTDCLYEGPPFSSSNGQLLVVAQSNGSTVSCITATNGSTVGCWFGPCPQTLYVNIIFPFTIALCTQDGGMQFTKTRFFLPTIFEDSMFLFKLESNIQQEQYPKMNLE